MATNNLKVLCDDSIEAVKGGLGVPDVLPSLSTSPKLTSKSDLFKYREDMGVDITLDPTIKGGNKLVSEEG